MHTFAARILAAATLGLIACSEDEPSMSSPVQAAGGAMAASGGSTSTSTSTSGGGGVTAPAGTAGGAGGSTAMPTAGSGPGAMSGRGGEPAMPAADAGNMQTADAGGTTAPGTCTRDQLKAIVDDYFTALAAHDPKMLPLADGVKFTENGEQRMLGEGLWATAGMVKFKEGLLDAQKCGTVTQAVVPDGGTDIPLAVRLKLEAGKITEIETIAVRSGDYIVANNTRNMIALMPWGEPVPEDQRQTREQLEHWIDKYFRMFPMGGCNLASDCRRMENGFSLACSAGATCSNQEPSGSAVMSPRLILSDVEASMAAGFTMFQGRYTDVHMIKYSGGQVRGVHTILGEADGSGWD